MNHSALFILFILFATVATAQNLNPDEVIGVTEVTYEWTPASGVVAGYAVFVDRNGIGFSSTPEQLVSDTESTVNASYGDTIVVIVIAYDANRNHGPKSEPSTLVTFLPPLLGKPGRPVPVQ